MATKKKDTTRRARRNDLRAVVLERCEAEFERRVGEPFHRSGADGLNGIGSWIIDVVWETSLKRAGLQGGDRGAFSLFVVTMIEEAARAPLSLYFSEGVTGRDIAVAAILSGAAPTKERWAAHESKGDAPHKVVKDVEARVRAVGVDLNTAP